MSGIRKNTTSSIIERAAQHHSNKYDYSLVEYKKYHDKIKIICPQHGVFEQTPANHLHPKKYGCKKCAGIEKSNTFDFIKKANKIHSNKYDYSLVEYINAHTKVKIICLKHGMFLQTPHKHLSKRGCPKCRVVSVYLSKGQKKLFVVLKSKYPNSKLEYLILLNNKKYYADIFIPELNTIIEYYGDYWHCNPKKYKSNYFHPHKKMYAKQIWDYDKIRKETLEQFGYKVFVVWELDCIKNKSSGFFQSFYSNMSYKL